MSLVALEIPRVGLVMEAGRIVRWLKSAGDTVRQGEPLLELETEKSIVEIEASASGRLVEILLQADQPARVGDRIAWLQPDNGTAAATSPRATTGPASQHRPLTAVPPAGPAGGMPDVPVRPRVRSSPAARRLAAQHGIDLHSLSGTGPRGRVQISDVARTIDPRPAHATPDGSRSAPRPLSAMRRAMARAMTHSNASVPQFVVESAIDWTTTDQLRRQFNSRLPDDAPRLSLTDFLLQALAHTLRAVPELNATFSGDPAEVGAALIPAQGTRIGLVVALEDGVLVPVFRDVERTGLAEIARQRARLVAQAQQGRLRREDLDGATISVSNLGPSGPERFTAMINPPQSAILAVGRARDCVVARDGGIHVRPLSQLTLTVDHRVADGRLAAHFLARLIDHLSADQWRLSSNEDRP